MKADGSGESGGWGRPIRGCTNVEGTGGGGGALYVVAARMYCAEFAPDRGMNEERRDDGIGEVSRPILLLLGLPNLLGVRVFTVRPAKLAPGTRVNRLLPAVAEYCGVELDIWTPGVVFELYMAKPPGKGEAGSGMTFG